MKEPKEKKEKVIKNPVDTRVALLEQSIGFINQTLTRIEGRLDKMDSKIDNHFYWTIGAICSVFAIMAHGFHWI